ncbi:hypothetical protein CIPAW_02G102000 [Carya illinoinensis]|uniref:Uncharacterized protein n=1 Tax=Carya illinoinensis TaxID=32201 RepID=A0A8T1RBZ8_CARIL|nr:hypothetical protein CIPAW_02G102000 [Carya illinoinensis]
MGSQPPPPQPTHHLLQMRSVDPPKLSVSRPCLFCSPPHGSAPCSQLRPCAAFLHGAAPPLSQPSTRPLPCSTAPPQAHRLSHRRSALPHTDRAPPHLLQCRKRTRPEQSKNLNL